MQWQLEVCSLVAQCGHMKTGGPASSIYATLKDVRFSYPRKEEEVIIASGESTKTNHL